jgi:hypothetical protein
MFLGGGEELWGAAFVAGMHHVVSGQCHAIVLQKQKHGCIELRWFFGPIPGRYNALHCATLHYVDCGGGVRLLRLVPVPVGKSLFAWHRIHRPPVQPTSDDLKP